MDYRKNNSYLGYSLIEILVVIGIFAILSVVATQTVLISLRGAKKSESIVNVKEELDYAAEVVSRQLQNAQAITNPSSCDGEEVPSITYRSQYQSLGNFTCLDVGGDSYVASSSGGINYRLTSTKVKITTCSFSCTTTGEKTSIVFDVSGNAKEVSGAEGYTYSTSRYIFIQGSQRN
jgi:prepilin-type N-terminal cleavage/methylation domain-containing protein